MALISNSFQTPAQLARPQTFGQCLHGACLFTDQLLLVPDCTAWLGDRKGIRPVKKLGVGLLVVTF